jgi:hypothetical protein
MLELHIGILHLGPKLEVRWNLCSLPSIDIYINVSGYLCLMYGHAVEAAPTPIPMLESPCGTSDSVQTLSPTRVSSQNVLDSLRENAAHFTRAVSELKANYVRQFKKYIHR